MAEGGMRDALSILEQCLSYNDAELKLEDVEHIFGLTSTEVEVDLLVKIHQQQIAETISTLRAMYEQGMDTKKLAVDLLEIVKEALIYSDSANDRLLNKISPIEAQEILRNVSIPGLLQDANNLEDVISKERQNQNFLVYFEMCLINMANIKTAKNVEYKEVQEVKEIKEEKQEVKDEETKPVVEEVEIKTNEIDQDFILKLLLAANRDSRIADLIIYNKLDLYLYEPEKRKFYQLLIGTELLASSKDAMIVVGDKKQVDSINEENNNKELYKFVNEEFGIDKMIYAITNEQKDKLITRYKATPISERNKPVYVEKYQLAPKEKTKEEKLRELFGDNLKIEE